MASSIKLSILATLALLLAAPLVPAQTPAPGDQTVPPIQDAGDYWLITLDENGGPDSGLFLEAFVKLCQENTGINFTYSAETKALLQRTPVVLFGQKRIRKEDFYSFFQIMMIINKFVCTKVGPEHLAVVQVLSLDSQQGRNVKSTAEIITPEELEDYNDQPATMVTTTVELPNTDVRTLSNSMRSMITDPNTMQIIPVGNTSTLILTGFGSQVAALVRMLRLVDEASAVEDPVLPEFEVIKLEFASASEIADTVEELLEASVRAAGATGGAKQPQGVTGQIRQGTTETKIMVYERTNALLVMAMPDDMPRIKELVSRLDIDVIERERTYHFYNLENADAEELATVLEDFLQDATRVQPSGQPTARGGQQQSRNSSSNEVVVVPDPATNSLLIAATRTRYEEILELVQLLDKRQDQVLIETALVELTGRDILDLGVELGGADIPGTGDTGGFGLTDFGLSTISDTDGDGIPDVRVPDVGMGITAGILDGDDFSLPLLISALEDERDTNVLNVPSVLVNNNGSATVRTLDEQPTTTITATGGVAGQTQENFNNYQEAGITLKISPTISASRYLRLGIELEVSNFIGTFSAGSIPPPRITRTLVTTVNVPDGDTMVIGGIIIDNQTSNTQGVPFLKDLPLVGVMFRRNTDNAERTSLYFFVTPHIMRDREFADLAEWSYKKKLEAANTIGVDRIRFIDDRFMTEEEGLELSGFDVPLYEPPTRGEVDDATIGADPKKASEMLDGQKPAPEQK